MQNYFFFFFFKLDRIQLQLEMYMGTNKERVESIFFFRCVSIRGKDYNERKRARDEGRHAAGGGGWRTRQERRRIRWIDEISMKREKGGRSSKRVAG